MPLYEYQCGACGARFELIRKFSDPPLEVCPTCGKGPVQKLISSPAFQFKGSGWYITDYARKSGSGDSKGGEQKGSDSKSDKESSSQGESKSDSKSESKPASDASSSKDSKSADKSAPAPTTKDS
jgi:putative FmdB family regulatory protein